MLFLSILLKEQKLAVAGSCFIWGLEGSVPSYFPSVHPGGHKKTLAQESDTHSLSLSGSLMEEAP